jgi:hypothetical protein
MMTNMAATNRLSLAQAAVQAETSTRTVSRAIANGELTTKCSDGRLTIDSGELYNWIQRRGNRQARLLARISLLIRDLKKIGADEVSP